MSRLPGRLVAPRAVALDGYTVVATFEQQAGGAAPVDARRATPVERDGRFELELPDIDALLGPITVTALGPDGLPAATEEVPRSEDLEPIELEVVPPPVITVEPSPDITLGRPIRYTGRAIDLVGESVREGVLVVIRARRAEGRPAVPVSVTRTSAGGYFAGAWPSDVYTEAFGQLDGGAPIPIGLAHGRLPLRIVLVSTVEHPAAANGDCTCGDSPPRAPDPLDLASNPQAYAADSGHCVDFTIPDRTVDEVTYQAVVRTTQPQLKAAVPLEQPAIPQALLERLAELALRRPRRPVRDAPSNPTPQDGPILGGGSPFEQLPPGRNDLVVDLDPATPTTLGDDAVLPAALAAARRFLPGIDLDGGWASETGASTAERVLAERARAGTPLELQASVLTEIAREPAALTPSSLVKAEQRSVVRRFRTAVGLLARSLSGRFTLDQERQIDWDELPDAYQATTIAHGHLLTLKQVWRADGFSLGEPLYSLPLAPGQQKLVSVLDWNRTEVASRRAEREASEELVADLTHDRDIAEVINSTLTERMRGESRSTTGSIGSAFAGFVGALVFGDSWGISSSGSTASQTSARALTGSALQQIRDRTLQSASVVRGQRATVVQTGRQGESVRAQTEVVANYNHCHSLTIQYFEVLRHLQVTQELAAVQECLFVPFAITPFTPDTVLRWRRPLVRSLRRPRLERAFDALERVEANWEGADVPAGRFADEQLIQLDGELTIRTLLPRPTDGELDEFVDANWDGYRELLWDTPANVFTRYLGGVLPEDRDAVWDARIAPGIAQALLGELELELVEPSGAKQAVTVDSTLVSGFAQDRPLLVTVRAVTPLPTVLRAEIERVRLSLGISNLPPGALLVVDSASLRYRTDHLSHHLFQNRRISNDLTLGDDVEIATPLDTLEKRNPRELDVRLSDELVAHLDEHVEYYHRAIWLSMDPNRRYLLLDGFIAPNASGRSVASVVENRVVGVVGNSLVMPVAAGQELDPTYRFADATPRDLRHLYAADPAPPMRISLPTSGVFAEAVMGSCQSCEQIDDTRFWRWEEAPIPDRPVPIEAIGAGTRATPAPSLAPDQLPEPVVGYQQAPAAPDPTGLAAAVAALGTNNIFRDLTGLAMNQANSAEALRMSLGAAKSFASKAGALAQQQFLNRELDRSLGHIAEASSTGLITDEQKKALTESVLRGAIGAARPVEVSATDVPALQRAISQVGDGGRLVVTQPAGTVDVTVGADTGESLPVDAAADPPIVPIQQLTNMVCWAAAGAMMESWRAQQSLTVEAVLDAMGGPWRGRYDLNEGLSVADVRAFTSTLGLVEDPPQSYTPDGLATLVSRVGPLLAIGDDAIQGNVVVHARIVDSVKGDGSLDGTIVIVADSATGTFVPMTFRAFDVLHHAADPVSLGMGFFHW
jgi:hypothetical protein